MTGVIYDAEEHVPTPDARTVAEGEVRGDVDPDAALLENFRALLREIGEDSCDDILDSFRTESTENVADMRRAVVALDAEGLRKAAHTLKGSSLTIGAGTLARLSADLEALARAGSLATATQSVDNIEREFQRAHARLAAEYASAGL